ncbi:MAG: beta galactosidase jelly roll domain-containing protein [Firmicutes bacterium]|nr:beta galactosidase jelly roll domain-containing protein [Bacillota bacterium]
MIFRNSERTKLDLGGWWEFKPGDINAGEWLPIAVPGTWNTSYPELMYHEGEGWYRHVFRVRERLVKALHASNARLIFEGVNYETQVWLNGKHLGGHEGGFTPFALPCAEALQEENTLLVRVDNRRTADRVPHWDYDWFNYGGIYRPVWLEIGGSVQVESLAVETVRLEGGAWQLKTGLQVRHYGGPNIAHVRVRLFKDGQEVSTENVARDKAVELSPGGTTAVRMILPVDGIRPWSPETPELYTLAVEVSAREAGRAEAAGGAGEGRKLNAGLVLDRIYCEIGFREFVIRDGRFWLNGEEFRFRGVGKHDEYAALGRAVPLSVYLRDFVLMKQANVNAFRTSHYAPSMDAIELADKMGLAVILEGASFFHTGFARDEHYAGFNNRTAVESGKRQMAEAIATFRNHPSVLMWSFGNEMGTDSEESRPFILELYDLVKGLDPTRPAGYSGISVYPAAPAVHDRACDMVDYVDVHLYGGWYEEETYGTIQQCGQVLDILHRMFPDKPIIIGEFGAEGLAGYRSLEKARWSEDYQSDFINAALDEYLRRDFVYGTFLWNFCDFRTPRHRALRRAREFNNKGMLDSARNPKLAYLVIKERYGRQIQVANASKESRARNKEGMPSC